jgi:DNA-directed RNA polymerase subunit RPC12/RpoP
MSASRDMRLPGWFGREDGAVGRELLRRQRQRRLLALCLECGRPLRVLALDGEGAHARCDHCGLDRTISRRDRGYGAARVRLEMEAVL